MFGFLYVSQLETEGLFHHSAASFFLLFQDCDAMKGECLSSQKLSMKWCFLDCKSKPAHGFSAESGSRRGTDTCSLSFRHNCRSLLQDRPSSGVTAAECNCTSEHKRQKLNGTQPLFIFSKLLFFFLNMSSNELIFELTIGERHKCS